MRIQYFLLLLAFQLSLHAHNKLFIVIHGTWASDMTWHMPGGDFFDQLQKSADQCDGYVIPYVWSGKLDHGQRTQAAKGLKQLIQSYDQTTKIYLIGHSHGGNVAALTTQLLAQDLHNQHSITALYMLGTPISSEHYWPDMDSVHYVYNLFSSGDMIQHVFGRYDRELPKHPCIANLRVVINNIDPGHSNIHHPVIARWLPLIPDILMQQEETGFAFFTYSTPGVIKFSYHAAPRYEIDLRRKFLDVMCKEVGEKV